MSEAGGVTLRPFVLSDYADALALWQLSDGVQLRDADSVDAITRYLARNPGLSFVAQADGAVVGTILAGHDGRRGYLQHVAVHPDWQRQHIGTRLVDASLAALRCEQILKVHVMIMRSNTAAQAFWQQRHFHLRSDIVLMSHTESPSA